MKKLVYSPDYTEKMRKMKQRLTLMFDEKVSNRVIKEIGSKVRSLKQNEKIGISVREMYGVDSDFLFVFIEKNYVFYLIEPEYIKIVNIYNEKEDFMRQLFNIKTTSQESEDYWDDYEWDLNNK